MTKDEQLNAQGEDFANAKNYDAAILYFREAIKYNPLNARSYQNLGICYTWFPDNSSYKDLVVTALEDALLLAPERLFLQATIDNFKSAIIKSWAGLAGGLKKSHQYDAFSLYHKALRLVNAYQYQGATRIIQEADAMDELGENGNEKHSNGTMKFYYISYKTSTDFSSTVVEIKHKERVSFNLSWKVLFGIAYSRTKDYTIAKKYFDSAIQHTKTLEETGLPNAWFNLDLSKAYYERGLIHQIEGNAVDAVDDFEKAIQLMQVAYEEEKKYVYRPGPFLALQKEQPKLKEKIEQSIRRAAEAKQAYFEGNYSKALKLAEEAVSMNRKNEQGHLYLSLTSLRLNQYSTALIHLEQFSSLVKQNSSADNLYQKAVALRGSLVKQEEQQEEAYLNWLKELPNKLPQDVLEKAINAVVSGGNINIEKQKKIMLVCSNPDFV